MCICLKPIYRRTHKSEINLFGLIGLIFRAKESVFSKKKKLNQRMGRETAMRVLPRLKRHPAPMAGQNVFLK